MSGHNQAPGKGLILVVDDEALVRMGVVDIVEEAGFDVLEASNADEAIRILEFREDIILIVTDIDMPAGSMNGLRLATAVKRRWPPIHIIVVSGHYRASAADLPADTVFLSKPYQPEQLVAQIQMLAA
jgi:two-component system, response regulator PdtaR